MKPMMLLAFATTFLVAAQAPPTQPPRSDQERLQGTWDVTAFESNGDKTAPEKLQDLRLVFQGNEWTVRKGNEIVSEGTFKLDPTQTPRAMSSRSKGTQNDELGIYAIEGETLKYCYAPSGEPRPKEFAATKGSGRTYIVLSRRKP